MLCILCSPRSALFRFGLSDHCARVWVLEADHCGTPERGLPSTRAERNRASQRKMAEDIKADNYAKLLQELHGKDDHVTLAELGYSGSSQTLFLTEIFLGKLNSAFFDSKMGHDRWRRARRGPRVRRHLRPDRRRWHDDIHRGCALQVT